MTRTPATLIAFTLLLAGCKPDAAVHHAETINEANGSRTVPANLSTSPTTLIDPTTFGSIKGTIKFSGPAPKRIKIDITMDPGCALAKEDNYTEQFLVDHGHLANVFVFIKSGIAPTSAGPNAHPVILDQVGCRYVPHVIALQQGGSVEFRNSDPTMHNIHMAPTDGPSMDVSQGPSTKPQTQQFPTPEIMLPVRCNNHPWMNAFINVAPTPYFAISNIDGSFSIPSLPPGTYTLAAVHEKLGEQDIQITVPTKSTAKADFTFAQ